MNRTLELHAERLRLCDELLACLAEERAALIALDTEQLVQCSVRKQGLGQRLALRHRELKLSLDAGLPEGWPAMQREWDSGWSEVQKRLESNQRLIGKSLKTLGHVVDNLKRLLGDAPVYTKSGKSSGPARSGKVVEARY